MFPQETRNKTRGSRLIDCDMANHNTAFGFKDYSKSIDHVMQVSDKMNERMDIASCLQLGRAEVMSGLKNFLGENRLKHHNIDCLKRRGVEKGGSQNFTEVGKSFVSNHTNIGTALEVTL